MTTEQRASESAIRELIERWATAVHAGDLDAVLAEHSDDIPIAHEHHSFPARG